MEDIPLSELSKIVVIDFGHRSKIWLVQHTSNYYALKEVPKEVLTELDVQHLFEEKRALTELDHPNIISLITTYKDATSIYFLLKLANGAPLSHIIKQQRRFHIEQISSIICQTAQTLAHIHSQGFIYRDLKLSNLLLDQVGKVTFVDFGLCTKVGANKAFTVTGTRHAMSPEIFKHLLSKVEPPGYSHEVDWWALGIMTFELFKGVPPFGLFGEDIFQNIIQGIDSVDMEDITAEGVDFIKKLLIANPECRLGHHSPGEVLSHPFIRDKDQLIVPTEFQMGLIRTWCEFLDDSEALSGPDPFTDF